MKKIETKEAPGAVGPYSQGIETEKFLYISGQLPVDPKTGQMVEMEIKVQTDRVIENLKAVLGACRVQTLVKLFVAMSFWQT